jgi:hypothetical protein
MVNLSRLVACVQSLFGQWSDDVAESTGVIQRQRKFTPRTLAITYILGFLQNPHASDEELAQMAAVVGEAVTPQAIEQRYHERMIDFLQGLFVKAAHAQIASDRALVPLLERFSDVQLLDSTTISLPTDIAERFAEQFVGCGGNQGGTAALKLQVRLSLKTGCLDAVRVEAGRDCDVKTPLQKDTPKSGSLRIADLGYFDTETFRRIDQAGAYWLSPFRTGTHLYEASAERVELRMDPRVDLLDWLHRNGAKFGTVIDRQVEITDARMRCRLIAWRLPQEVADRRRRRLREQSRRKGRTPSAERLAQCDWAILITNVPAEALSVDEARVLYRARWQIELLFKRWKSQGFVDAMTDASWIRCLVKLWSRLLAAVVQQWLQSSVWGRPEISLKKVWDLLTRLTWSLARAWSDPSKLRTCLEDVQHIAQSTVRQNKRKKPSTFEMLNDPARLPYALT